jgi:hypothetical protein
VPLGRRLCVARPGFRQSLDRLEKRERVFIEAQPMRPITMGLVNHYCRLFRPKHLILRDFVQCLSARHGKARALPWTRWRLGLQTSMSLFLFQAFDF